jgi:cytoskeleton protein RodZ
MRMDGLNILPNQVPVSAAPNAGADLRAARERLGWPLPDAAATLRIRHSYLEALEEGDLSQLPGNAYALGFLRSYACALGLDPEEMLRRFKSEAAEVSQRTELSFPAPVPERGLPMGAVILLGLILAVGAYIGWYRLSGEGRLPAETATIIPERLSSLAQQALPPPPAPAARTDAAAGSPEPQQAAPTLSPSSAAAAPVNPLPATPPAAIPPDQSRMTLRASADAWVEVRDKSGTVLLNRVLHPGDTWPVPPRPSLLLTTGNAAATEILVDGVTTVSLGGAGAVRRDLLLDADQVKAGKLAPSGVTPAPRTAQ